MPLSVYYGIHLFGALLLVASAVWNSRPGRGLIAFANDVLYIILIVPALLIVASQLAA